MPDESGRGFRPTVWTTERLARKRGHLGRGERILEWKLGRIRKWRADGKARPLPGFYGLERMSTFRGLTSISYSPRCLFLNTGSGLMLADLALIWHLEVAGNRSLNIIYSTMDVDSSIHLSSVRWRSDEVEEDEILAGFAARIRSQGVQRRSEMSPEWQEWAVTRPLELDATGVLQTELAQLMAEPADASGG